jgi:hypothetical protein
MPRRRGLQMKTARQRARDCGIETVSAEEELDVAGDLLAAGGGHREEDDLGLFWPWNLSTVPTRAPAGRRQGRWFARRPADAPAQTGTPLLALSSRASAPREAGWHAPALSACPAAAGHPSDLSSVGPMCDAAAAPIWRERMARSGRTGKKAAAAAGKTLRSKSASKTAKRAAASDLVQAKRSKHK